MYAIRSYYVTVTIFDKGYAEYDYQEYITYKFAFENKTDKEITAFTGQIMFTDLFDKEIKSLNLTYDDGVAASSIKNYSATTDYNQFMDEDQLLKSKNLKQIKLVWKPEKILFADGSTLRITSYNVCYTKLLRNDSTFRISKL